MSSMPAGDGLTVKWYPSRNYDANCIACGAEIEKTQRAAALMRRGFSHKFADTVACVLTARNLHLV